MKASILPMVVGAAVMWSGMTVQADPFLNLPELNHPGWVTSFPYQRNILAGFDTDPHSWPDHESSPAPGDRKALTPDVVHHEGVDDGDLYRSDWLGGEATGKGYSDWIDTASSHPGRQGMLKLAVDAGMGATTIRLVWHIDNWDRPWQEKHFFAEAEYYTTGNTGSDQLFGSQTSGLPVTLTPHYETLGDGWIRWWAEGTLVPNPSWEQMVTVVEFTASTTDSYLLIDYMHIATECVPEPASLLLLACGLVILSLCGRR